VLNSADFEGLGPGRPSDDEIERPDFELVEASALDWRGRDVSPDEWERDQDEGDEVDGPEWEGEDTPAEAFVDDGNALGDHVDKPGRAPKGGKQPYHFAIAQRKRMARAEWKRQQIFELHTGPEKLSFPAIAERMGISLASASTGYYRKVRELYTRDVEPDRVAEMRLKVGSAYEEILERGLERMNGDDANAPAFGALALRAAEGLGKLYRVDEIEPGDEDRGQASARLLQRVAELSPGVSQHLTAIKAIERARQKGQDMDAGIAQVDEIVK